jgi:hypothetical protein
VTAVTFVVLGEREVVAKLQLEVQALRTLKAEAGLLAGAHAVQRKAKENLAPHHYKGRAEQQTTVSAPLITPGSVTVTVGIHGGIAPEGRPLEYGWKSAGGKQPPTQAIADWLISSGRGASMLSSAGVELRRNKAGFITGAKARRVAPTDASKVKGLAFVIARNIKRRGYSFGELHWLENALRDETPTVLAELLKATRL